MKFKNKMKFKYKMKINNKNFQNNFSKQYILLKAKEN